MRIPRITILILTVVFFGFLFSEALGWTLSVPLPGYGNFSGASTATDPAQYIKNIYLFSMGFGALLAIVVIIIGAVRFTVSEAIPSQEAAREQIMNAVWGLVLLLGAYVIGTTINPKIDPLNPPPLPTLAPLPKLEICNNGQNDDEDQFVLDSDDPDCATPPGPGSGPTCSISPFQNQYGPAPFSGAVSWSASSENPPLYCTDPNEGTDPSGSMTFNLTKLNDSQVFTISCSDQSLSSCSASVTMTATNPSSPQMTCAFFAKPNTISVGQTASLSWNVSGGTAPISCVGTNSQGGDASTWNNTSKPASGSETLTGDKPNAYVFTLTCQDSSSPPQSTSCSTNVTVK